MPDLIGPYQVSRELRRGGMGVVCLATDTRLDRQVAIKALAAAYGRVSRHSTLLAYNQHGRLPPLIARAEEIKANLEAVQ